MQDLVDDCFKETPPACAESSAPAGAPPISPYKTKRIEYKGLRMDHFLVAGGVLRRFVVVETPRLRDLLRQPRKREIPALRAQQQHFELRTSELCELAWEEAKRFLRALHAQALAIEQRRSPPTQAPTRRLRHVPTEAIAGVITAQPVRGEASGRLLQAGVRNDGSFAIDLYDEETRQLLRLDDTQGSDPLDLLRALEASGAEPFDRIHIRPTGEEVIPLREHRTGVHGEANRTVKHRRPTFEVIRESSAQRSKAVPSLENHGHTRADSTGAAPEEYSGDFQNRSYRQWRGE